jgi:hypothetical protein
LFTSAGPRNPVEVKMQATLTLLKPVKGKMEEFFDKWFVVTVVSLIILSVLHVANTELLKLYNEMRMSKVDNSAR